MKQKIAIEEEQCLLFKQSNQELRQTIKRRGNDLAKFEDLWENFEKSIILNETSSNRMLVKNYLRKIRLTEEKIHSKIFELERVCLLDRNNRREVEEFNTILDLERVGTEDEVERASNAGILESGEQEVQRAGEAFDSGFGTSSEHKNSLEKIREQRGGGGAPGRGVFTDLKPLDLGLMRERVRSGEQVGGDESGIVEIEDGIDSDLIRTII